MKRSELKQILKPLIKECIKEAILEEGILSNVVSEVVKGLGTNTIVEQKTQPAPRPTINEEREREHIRAQTANTRKKMLDAIGNASTINGVNVFEGTEPLRRGGSAAASVPSSPLGDVDPGDAGINIDGIFSVGGSKWKALMGK